MTLSILPAWACIRRCGAPITRVLLLALLLVTATALLYPKASQAQQFAIGVGGSNFEIGQGIAVDDLGNSYVTGFFEGTADFDPSSGSTELSSNGGNDIFVASYDSNGNFRLAIGIGGAGRDQGLGIAVDGSGNSYVTGFFNDTVDFDPGSGTTTLTSSGGEDIFVASYDSNGDLRFARGIGSGANDRGSSIAVDGSGNSHITGTFSGKADFDPGLGTTELTTRGLTDIFLASYDSNGDLRFAHGIGGTGNDRGSGIAVDGSGNSYVTGTFTGTADFDPSSGTTELDSGSTVRRDIFVASYTNTGALRFAINVGSSSADDNANSIAVDDSGNSYITGTFIGTVDFEPGAGTTELSAGGFADMFVAGYTNTGALRFAINIGNTGSRHRGLGIAIDGSGNSYVTGVFQGTVDFDPGSGTAELTSSSSNREDIFVASYDDTGDLRFASGAGDTETDRGLGIAVDGSGNSYVTGYFNGTADFEPGAGTTELTSSSLDFFVVSYDSDGRLTPQVTLSAPADGGTDQPLLPTFEWTDPGTGATTYTLEYATDNGLTTDLVTETGIVQTTFTPGTALGGQTTYYWRVSAVDGGGTTIITSSTFSFTTVSDLDGDGTPDANDDDDDSDNVEDTIEAGAPNGGDGNNDGTPDSEQLHVASIPNNAGSGYLTVVSNSGGTPVNLMDVSVSAPAGPPIFVFMPLDQISFSVEVAVGGTATVDIIDHAQSGASLYYKFQNGVWSLFAGHSYNPSTHTHTLTLVDGGAGDSDGVANGVIVDPGAPAAVLALTAPTDAATGQALLPTFEWTDSGTGAATYTLEYATDSGFTTDLVTETGIVGTSFTPSMALDSETTYYWRVRAVDSTPATIVTSATFFFTTAGLTLTAPTDGATDQPLAPTFEWTDTGVGAATYTLEYATDSGFTTDLVTETGIAGTSFTPSTALDSETTYYWRVSAVDATPATIITSAAFSFTTSAFLVAPFNTLTGLPIEPTFDWIDITGADSYTLELATDNALSSLIHTETGLTASTFTLDYDLHVKLGNSTTYYWRVTSIEGGVPTVSDVWSFTTTTPGLPVLSDPGDGATAYTLTPLLEWFVETSTDGLSYDVEVRWDEDDPLDGGDAPIATSEGWHSTQHPAPVGLMASGIDGGTTEFDASGFADDLVYGYTYHWRVRSYNSQGTVNYSDVFTFTVDGAMLSPPTLSYPVAGATVYTNTPTGNWYLLSYTPGMTYDVEYANVTEGGSLTGTPDVSGLTARSYTFPTLEPGDTYTWTVRSFDGTTYSAWASPETFVVEGEGTVVQTILSYPIGGTTIFNTAVDVSWYLSASSAGLTFDVDYGLASGSITDNQVTTSATRANLSGLIPGETYQWRVTAKNGLGDTEVSAIETFVVTGGITNGLPTASYPSGSATVYTLTPELSWYVEGSTLGLTGFIVSWGPSALDCASLGSQTLDASARTYTLTAGEALEWDTAYCWQVQSTDGATPSVASQGLFVTTGGGSDVVPVASYPASGEVFDGVDVTLSWYTSAPSGVLAEYEVEYTRAAFFSTESTTAPIGGTATVSPSSATELALTGLIPGSTYRWRVRAVLTDGSATSYSNTGTFMLQGGAALVQPRIGSPVAGVLLGGTGLGDAQVAELNRVVLSWGLPVATTAALTYDVEIATSARLASTGELATHLTAAGSQELELIDPVTYTDVASGQQVLTGLEAGATYFWRVRSRSAMSGEATPYSPVGVFRVAEGAQVVSIEDEPEAELPSGYVLKQNYPNPFNPETRIAFTVAASSEVTLVVYDMLGRRVQTLVSGSLEAGRHEAVWNAVDARGQSVSSGVYLYRLSVRPLSGGAGGERVLTRYMTLMK